MENYIGTIEDLIGHIVVAGDDISDKQMLYFLRLFRFSILFHNH